MHYVLCSVYMHYVLHSVCMHSTYSFEKMEGVLIYFCMAKFSPFIDCCTFKISIRILVDTLSLFCYLSLKNKIKTIFQLRK